MSEAGFINRPESDCSDPARCPLCGGPNACQLCTEAAYKGPCWCAQIHIPDLLLARVPEHLRRHSCICRNCVEAFHRAVSKQSAGLSSLRPGDFYFEPGGLMVLTKEYLLRRGYCCHNGCRHCPYGQRG